MSVRRKQQKARRLAVEVAGMQNSVEVISANPDSDSWIFKVTGYGELEGHTFTLKLVLSDKYPFQRPSAELTADTPNSMFDCEGFGASTLKGQWSPCNTVLDMLRHCSEMLCQPRHENQGWRLTRNHSWRTVPLQPPLVGAQKNQPAISYVDAVPGLVHIRGALVHEECVALIELAEACGFSDAHHVAYQNRSIDAAEERYRRNDHVVYQAAAEECAKLFQRVTSGLPAEIDARAEYCPAHVPWQRIPPERFGAWLQDGLNDMWRFYRYDPRYKQEFPIHNDNATIKRQGRLASWLSVLVYLSDSNFIGGSTAFFDQETGRRMVYEVKPRQGDVVMFFHHGSRSVPHAGMPVTGDACKYVLRTDAMYRATSRVKDGPTMSVSPPYDAQRESDDDSEA